MFSSSSIVSSYNVFDKYIEDLFPSVHIVLRSYDEKDEREYINPEYPDRTKWKEIAAQKEADLKVKALDVLMNIYNKDQHINHIIYEKISLMYRRYYSGEMEISKRKVLAETYWSEPQFQEVLKNIEYRPDRFMDVIYHHNSNLSIYNLI
jgi:hypothetical protein